MRGGEEGLEEEMEKVKAFLEPEDISKDVQQEREVAIFKQVFIK